MKHKILTFLTLFQFDQEGLIHVSLQTSGHAEWNIL